MAQKVHPTGFRIGVTKTPKAIWFAPFGKFHKVLREDAEVIKIWERVTSLKRRGNLHIALAARITRIDIQRRLNLLQLTVSAGSPNILLADDCALFETFKKELNDFDNKTRCRIKLVKVEQADTSASVIARQLADNIGARRMPITRAMSESLKILKAKNVPGFKIQLSGRLNGADIARRYWIREGRVPMQTLTADIDYAFHEAKTKYGIIGIKVSIFTGRASHSAL